MHCFRFKNSRTHRTRLQRYLFNFSMIPVSLSFKPNACWTRILLCFSPILLSTFKGFFFIFRIWTLKFTYFRINALLHSSNLTSVCMLLSTSVCMLLSTCTASGIYRYTVYVQYQECLLLFVLYLLHVSLFQGLTLQKKKLTFL